MLCLVFTDNTGDPGSEAPLPEITFVSFSGMVVLTPATLPKTKQKTKQIEKKIVNMSIRLCLRLGQHDKSTSFRCVLGFITCLKSILNIYIRIHFHRQCPIFKLFQYADFGFV